MYILDLESVKDLPACRKVYQSGDSYCALGKLMKGCGVRLPEQTEDGTWTSSEETGNFAVKISKRINNYNWSKEVSDLNDAPGDLRENHKKAFDLAVQYALQSELVMLKSEVENKEKVTV